MGSIKNHCRLLVLVLMLELVAGGSVSAEPIINIFAAWYGIDGGITWTGDTPDTNVVVDKLRQQCSKDGFIFIPGNMNAYWGEDPIPGSPKNTALAVLYQGKDVHLRAPEGQNFIFNENDVRAKLGLAALPAPAAPASSYALTKLKKSYFPAGMGWSLLGQPTETKFVTFTMADASEVDILLTTRANIDPLTDMIGNQRSYYVVFNGWPSADGVYSGIIKGNDQNGFYAAPNAGVGQVLGTLPAGTYWVSATQSADGKSVMIGYGKGSVPSQASLIQAWTDTNNPITNLDCVTFTGTVMNTVISNVTVGAVPADTIEDEARYPFTYIAAWYGLEGEGMVDENRVGVSRKKLFDSLGNVAIPASSAERAAKYGSPVQPENPPHPKVLAFAISYKGQRMDFRAFDGLPFTLTPERIDALLAAPGKADVQGPVVSALYISANDSAKFIDVTTKVNTLIACYGGGFNLQGYFYDAVFGDPAPGDAKALVLTLVNGLVVTCQSAQNKGVYLTAQDFSNLAAYSVLTSFSYPISAIGQAEIFNKKWKLPAAGSGAVQFQASASSDIYVALASTPNMTDPKAYCFVIGGWGNKHSELWRGNMPGATSPGSLADRTPDTTDAGKKGEGTVVTGGTPGRGDMLEDYWVCITKGMLSWGKGTVVGQKTQQSWADPNPIASVQYVGLGGVAGDLKYQGIRFSEATLNIISQDQLKKLSVEKLSPEEVQSFAATQVPWFLPSQLATLLPNLKTQQVKAISKDQVKELTTSQIKSLLFPGGMAK